MIDELICKRINRWYLLPFKKMPQVETMTRDSNKGVGGNERSSTQALVLYTFEASSSNEMSIIGKFNVE